MSEFTKYQYQYILTMAKQAKDHLSLPFCDETEEDIKLYTKELNEIISKAREKIKEKSEKNEV